MTYLDCQDEFSVVSVLVCLVTYWIGLTVNHNVKLLGFYDSLNYYIALILNLEMILSLC